MSLRSLLPRTGAGWLRATLIVLLVVSCGASRASAQCRRRLSPRHAEADPEERVEAPTPRLVAQSGGRVAWYHGTKKLISLREFSPAPPCGLDSLGSARAGPHRVVT